MSSKRSPEMQQVLDAFTRNASGRTLTHSLYTYVCVTCGKPVGKFRDEESRTEYTISGMCQACQDAVLEGGNNER